MSRYIYNSDQCQGFTKKGERCGKRTKTGQYCHLHRAKSHTPTVTPVEEDTSLNDENVIEENCGICLEPVKVKSDQDAEFECGHYFHVECAKMMRDPRCPACRRDIKSKKLGNGAIARMEQRRRHDQREREEEIPPEAMRHVVTITYETNSPNPPRGQSFDDDRREISALIDMIDNILENDMTGSGLGGVNDLVADMVNRIMELNLM